MSVVSAPTILVDVAVVVTAVIRPEPGEWHSRMPECLDQEELALPP